MNLTDRFITFIRNLLEKKLMKRIIKKIRNRYYFLADFLIFIFIPLLAFYIRYDGLNLPLHFNEILFFGLFFAVVKSLILYFSGMYSRWWINASIEDMLLILFTGFLIFVIQTLLLLVLKALPIPLLSVVPFSVSLLDSFFSLAFISLSRLSIRIFGHKSFNKVLTNNEKTENVIIVGAGNAGIMVLEEMKRNNNGRTCIVGFIDDDERKRGMRIHGVKVLGSRTDIPEVVHKNKVHKILIAIPSASGIEIKDLLDICNTIDDIEVLTLPPIYDIIDGKVEINKLRKVEIEDLLKRDPIKTDIASITDMLQDKVVLVTGGGGSIGSELCRQILRCNPNTLLLLGHGENSVFEIDMELKNKFPDKNIIPVIADVTDFKRMKSIFSNYDIDFVFHAAAHKHVPLMEHHPYEAIKNNIIGTKNLVDLAIEFDIEKLVKISTDKAVNPTSVMGTSKRIGEMLVINSAKNYHRKFSVVRFGNVLGSRGSVVKIFKSQIQNGGPITITHPDITRYFMTIPEAVQLVLQAFIIGNGGDIFIFDMGKPVKIMDLARDLIKLSGLTISHDIDIKVTGLRPGEKLFEELFNGGESFKNTINEKIYIADNSEKIVPEDFEDKLNALLELIENPDLDVSVYKSYLKNIVPEYNYNNGNYASVEWKNRL